MGAWRMYSRRLKRRRVIVLVCAGALVAVGLGFFVPRFLGN